MSLPEQTAYKKDIEPDDLEQLVYMALSLGATQARVIASREIIVAERLARLCAEPRCENYGLSPSCPPHVSGPVGFRQMQKTHPWAIVIRVVVPASILLSSARTEMGRYLHEVVATVEQEAVRMGYSESQAFAGGSCKELFCYDHLECQRLSEVGMCRHPELARPSMSGYGIDVVELMKTCGWPASLSNNSKEMGEESMTWVAGLVMIR